MNQQDQIKRQINAAKDYLRRLHPRFEEERKQREEFIQQKEAELKELEKENGAKTPQLEPCPFCGSVPTVESTGIFCDYEGCYVQPSVCCEMPDFLPQLWNTMAKIEEANETGNPVKAESGKIESDKTPEARRDDPISFFEVNPCAKCGYDPQVVETSEMVTIYCPKCTRVSQFKERNKAIEFWNKQNPLKEKIDYYNPFKPCAKCGSPVEWEMSLSGRRGWVKCPRCGNKMTVDDEEYHTMEEWLDMWNQVNTKPENQIPPKFSQVMKEIEQRIPVKLLNKLYLLNSILGLQRDEKGPVIEVKKIQETILEIDRTLQKGEIWKNDEAISELAKQSEKMKSDEYLAPSENRKIAVHGSVYVMALHIAGAVCREAKMYAWEYEQKHGIEELSQVCKYLDQLSEWLFVRAEYLRETEECF